MTGFSFYPLLDANRASKYAKQKLIVLNGEIRKSEITLEGSRTPNQESVEVGDNLCDFMSGEGLLEHKKAGEKQNIDTLYFKIKNICFYLALLLK